MYVSGFTIVRNAVKYDYPIVEAITSILDLCDEFIVAVGNSEDETEELIRRINSDKIKIVHTVWDDSLREGGRVLASETNKAFSFISSKADWAFYIQADEVVHEKYLPVINEAMIKWKDTDLVEGLLFNYLHFYGSYDFVGDSRKWYRKEIRIVKNKKGIESFRDAQGFRINNRIIKVKPIDAYIYHYGWVKPPDLQQAKQKYFHKLWHDDHWLEKNIKKGETFDYGCIDSLVKFEGTHPKVITNRVMQKNWQFNFDPSKKNFGLKAGLLYYFEKLSGYRIGEYRNYKTI
ncbi:MAG: hypothetical protein PHT69_09090 [Bacteroidales bacterium]|nr:hypothetical protein [Bacteroidales bacterium]